MEFGPAFPNRKPQKPNPDTKAELLIRCARQEREIASLETELAENKDTIHRLRQAYAQFGRRKKKPLGPKPPPQGTFEWAVWYATKRGKTFTLTAAVYAYLTSQPCHYCGCHLAPQGMRLDRVDSKLGYIDGNVVPCCGPDNVKKGAGLTGEQYTAALAVPTR